MFSSKKKKKVMVAYKDNCPACHLFSLEQRSCMGPHSDKTEAELKLCDDYKLDLETFSSIIPRDIKITRWVRVKGGYLFEGIPKEVLAEKSGELCE